MAVTPENAVPAHGHGEYEVRRGAPERAQRGGSSAPLPSWFWPVMLLFAAILFAALLWGKFGSASSQQPPTPPVSARVDVYHHRVPTPPKPAAPAPAPVAPAAPTINIVQGHPTLNADGSCTLNYSDGRKVAGFISGNLCLVKTS